MMTNPKVVEEKYGETLADVYRAPLSLFLLAFPPFLYAANLRSMRSPPFAHKYTRARARAVCFFKDEERSGGG